MMHPRHLPGIVRSAYTGFHGNHCTRLAAALSFTTLLALVPLLTVAFTMLSLFPVFEDSRTAVQEFIYRNMVPAAGDTVVQYLDRFIAQAGRLTAVGLSVLLVTSLLLLSSIENAFNEIWGIESGRGLVQRVVVYWAVITLGPVLIVSSLSVSSYLLSAQYLPADMPGIQGLTHTLLSISPYVLQTAAFVLLYSVVPNTYVGFRYAVTGGIFAAVLFEISKKVFAIWILRFASYEAVYGTLASIPVFFVWIYLSWLVVLIGAEITVAASRHGDGNHDHEEAAGQEL